MFEITKKNIKCMHLSNQLTDSQAFYKLRKIVKINWRIC